MKNNGTYIITEGALDAELIKKILPGEVLDKVKVIFSGGFSSVLLSDDMKKDILERQFKIYTERIVNNITTPINDMIKKDVSHFVYGDINVEAQLAQRPLIKN